MVLRTSSNFTNTFSNPLIRSGVHGSSPNLPSHLNVSSSDLPPVPMQNSDRARHHNSHYEETGNPWRRDRSPQSIDVPEIPQAVDRIQAGGSQQGAELPSPLRAGQAYQHTPRSSLDSQKSKDFWEDDDEEEAKIGHSTQAWQDEGRKTEHINVAPVETSKDRHAGFRVTTAAASGVTQRPMTPDVQRESDLSSWPSDLSSNNPFRRNASTDGSRPQPSFADEKGLAGDAQWANSLRPLPGKGKEAMRLPTPEFSAAVYDADEPDDNAALATSCWNDSLTPGAHHYHHHPSMETLLLEEAYAPPPHPTVPPPPLPQLLTPLSAQRQHLSADSSKESGNPWQSEKIHNPFPSPDPPHQFTPPVAHYTDSLLDQNREEGVVSLKDALNASIDAAEFVSTSRVQYGASDKTEDDLNPTLPSRPQVSRDTTLADGSGGHSRIDVERFDPPAEAPRPRAANSDAYQPPPGPPPNRSSTVVSHARLSQMSEQRNETYQIKHFNWYDHRSSKLRTSSMLTQNKNGPCPLLALVNALILGVKEHSQAALDNALREREQVSLGLIIETLIDELISSNYESLPDVDELNRFLSMLHTGMNANPRFISPSSPAPNLMDARDSASHLPPAAGQEQQPGGFEATQDIKLYSAFSIPLLHGWLPSPREPAKQAFARSAQTYEDAQAVQFGEEELEYKLSHGGLTREERLIWEDITSIKAFLRSYPTQLTPYGLDVTRKWLRPGQFAIMFRNDHFSTIYKHPENGQLFTLITDAGYAERDEIIWESLSDHSGQSDFFSGDFRSVGGDSSDQSIPGGYPLDTNVDPSGPRRSSQHAGAPDSAAPLSPQERQEQHDADFAMALQLQEEEEQRSQPSRRQSAPRRQSQNNIPIRLRSQPDIRPIIPPRAPRPQITAVNRPVDTDADDAPPAYEEAAKSRPYVPPLGSPHHPAADPSPRGSTTQLTPTSSAASSAPPRQEQPSGQNPRRAQQRRTSAYGENSLRYGQQGLSPSSPAVSRGNAYGVGAGGLPYGRQRQNSSSRDPREDRDCIVM